MQRDFNYDGIYLDEIVPPARHKYPDRNSELTEIYLLRFREPARLIMCRSRHMIGSP
eukprot:COSAG01_NODE_955_length_12483_cov_19.703731_12_plen_57_part_00